jgi:hypothetical protein
MAKHILYNASAVLNSVDLSDHVESVSFTVTINGQAAAAMSELEDYEMPGTRKISDITLQMYQDFATSKVYATLMTLWTNRTTFNAVLKADAGGNAPTNPQFTIAVFIRSFAVIAGNRGDRHMTPLVLAPAGTLAIATA